jgi:hypothetical protein
MRCANDEYHISKTCEHKQRFQPCLNSFAHLKSQFEMWRVETQIQHDPQLAPVMSLRK